MNTVEETKSLLIREVGQAVKALTEIEADLWDERKNCDELTRGKLCHLVGRISGVKECLDHIVQEGDRLKEANDE